jgi:glyoxylase-like metal-dependent hydrolase (beta-lactamase superfamily II)
LPATSARCWPAKRGSITATEALTALPPPDQVAPDLWRLHLPIPFHTLGHVKLYLIRDADGFALVDCGMDLPLCRQALDRHLAALGLPLSALHTIVATHGHPDHIGQGPTLRQACGARIWLHRRDLAIIGPDSPLNDSDPVVLAAWLARYGFPPLEAEAASQNVEEYSGETKTVEPDRVLEGGERFEIGAYRFEVVPTPGHTPGHVCLFESNHRFLLSGDHLFGATAPNVRLMPYSSLDVMAQYLESLRVFARLAAERAWPGHGEPFEAPAARAEDVVRHQLRRREQLLDLLTARPQTPYELARQVWRERPERPGRSWDQFHGRLRRNAALTLAAHLELLARQGEIARQETETVAFSRR